MAKNQSQVTTLDDTDAAAEAAQNSEAVAEIVGANHDDQLSGDKAKITISPTEGDGGGDAVFAGLNGYGYNIPRGIPVSVPVELVKVLQDAKYTLTIAAQGGSTTSRVVSRFAMEVATA